MPAGINCGWWVVGTGWHLSSRGATVRGELAQVFGPRTPSLPPAPDVRTSTYPPTHHLQVNPPTPNNQYPSFLLEYSPTQSSDNTHHCWVKPTYKTRRSHHQPTFSIMPAPRPINIRLVLKSFQISINHCPKNVVIKKGLKNLKNWVSRWGLGGGWV